MKYRKKPVNPNGWRPDNWEETKTELIKEGFLEPDIEAGAEAIVNAVWDIQVKAHPERVFGYCLTL